jgi:hypothetical protein
LLLRWFPDRQFLFAGDQNYGSHEMAMLAPRTQGRLQMVSKLYPNANLYEPPTAYAGKGRPRVKGRKVPTPQEVVASAERTRLNVAWYGGGRRDVEVVTGQGNRIKICGFRRGLRARRGFGCARSVREPGNQAEF